MDENLDIVLKLEGLPQEEGHVLLSDFLEKLEALLTSLNCVDKAVAQSEKPTLTYQVVAASHSSPLTLAVRPTARASRNHTADIRETHHRFFQNLEAVRNRTPLAEDVDEETLQAFKRLVDDRGKSFSSAVISNGESKIELDEIFQSNITLLLAAETYSFGKVTGKLDAINIHGPVNTFWLYPEIGPKRIVCKFLPGTKEKAKSCLGKTVWAYGKKTFRPNAPYPHRIEVEDFDELNPSCGSVLSLRGISATSLSDVNVVSSVRKIRDEW